MKAKVKNSDEIINVYRVLNDDDGTFFYSGKEPDNRTWKAHEIELLPDTPEEVTIEGYVARGANPHHLALYERKPERLSDIWGFSHSLQLDPTFFPEITWGNSPKRVKITITPME